MNVVHVADSFVDLVKRDYNWSEIKTLPDNEIQILFDLVSAAGFEPVKMVPEKLWGKIRGQDGDTGGTYIVNTTCPYKVVGQDGDHYLATGWLEHIFSHVRRNVAEDYNELIRFIAREIERSVPLRPIQLTPLGDFLLEYPSRRDGYLVDHTRDKHPLPSCVGIHDCCNGWMDHKRATKTHDVLVCRNCFLRISFPREVKTYGELRQALFSAGPSF